MEIVLKRLQVEPLDLRVTMTDLKVGGSNMTPPPRNCKSLNNNKNLK